MTNAHSEVKTWTQIKTENLKIKLPKYLEKLIRTPNKIAKTVTEMKMKTKIR